MGPPKERAALSSPQYQVLFLCFVLYQNLWKHAYRDSLEVKQDSSLVAVNLSLNNFLTFLYSSGVGLCPVPYLSS